MGGGKGVCYRTARCFFVFAALDRSPCVFHCAISRWPAGFPVLAGAWKSGTAWLGFVIRFRVITAVPKSNDPDDKHIWTRHGTRFEIFFGGHGYVTTGWHVTIRVAWLASVGDRAICPRPLLRATQSVPRACIIDLKLASASASAYRRSRGVEHVFDLTGWARTTALTGVEPTYQPRLIRRRSSQISRQM